LGCHGVATVRGQSHQSDQTCGGLASDGAPGRLALGIQLELAQELRVDLDVLLGLLEVLLPLLLELLVLRRGDCRGVDQDAAFFGLERLTEKVVQCIHLMVSDETRATAW
jgi:hypothetical protein